MAFYPFTDDKRLAERSITEVLSGSVGVNDANVQVGSTKRLPWTVMFKLRG